MKCSSCRFWQQFEDNELLGMCSGIGVMTVGFRIKDPASVAITFIRPENIALNPPISDYLIRTQADFYCRSYMSKEEKEAKWEEEGSSSLS